MVNFLAVSDVADSAVIKSKQRSQYDIFVSTTRPLIYLPMMTATNRRAGQTHKIGLLDIDRYIVTDILSRRPTVSELSQLIVQILDTAFLSHPLGA